MEPQGAAVLALWPRPSSPAPAWHLDVEDVVEKTVELLIQQPLEPDLEVALSLLVVLARVQAQHVGHEDLDGVEVLVEADLGQRDSDGPGREKRGSELRASLPFFRNDRAGEELWLLLLSAATDLPRSRAAASPAADDPLHCAPSPIPWPGCHCPCRRALKALPHRSPRELAGCQPGLKGPLGSGALALGTWGPGLSPVPGEEEANLAVSRPCVELLSSSWFPLPNGLGLAPFCDGSLHSAQ